MDLGDPTFEFRTDVDLFEAVQSPNGINGPFDRSQGDRFIGDDDPLGILGNAVRFAERESVWTRLVGVPGPIPTGQEAQSAQAKPDPGFPCVGTSCESRIRAVFGIARMVHRHFLIDPSRA